MQKNVHIERVQPERSLLLDDDIRKSAPASFHQGRRPLLLVLLKRLDVWGFGLYNFFYLHAPVIVHEYYISL